MKNIRNIRIQFLKEKKICLIFYKLRLLFIIDGYFKIKQKHMSLAKYFLLKVIIILRNFGLIY